MTELQRVQPGLRRIAAGLLSAAALALLVPSSAQAKKHDGPRCEPVTFDVTLAPGETEVYQVVGELCSRGNVHHKTIQIALHGATYSHLYWDWPRQPETYSYVRRATDEGYVVLNLDRIGVGASDHPPAEEVTIAANAYVVHQIVQVLRDGDLVVHSFGRIRARRVVLVGHSLGSLISMQEAATYDDVDGVVLTGVSHTVTPRLGDLAAYPANLDPAFAGQGLPDGYLTTVPGTRTIFYREPFYHPAVLALDEQTKETVTVAELNTAVPALDFSSGIHVPVLVVVGDYDLAFCNEPSCTESGDPANEATFYPADACAEIAIIPKSGHDLNLHFKAPKTYSTMLKWIDRRVGSNTKKPVPDPCP